MQVAGSMGAAAGASDITAREPHSDCRFEVLLAPIQRSGRTPLRLSTPGKRSRDSRPRAAPVSTDPNALRDQPLEVRPYGRPLHDGVRARFPLSQFHAVTGDVVLHATLTTEPSTVMPTERSRCDGFVQRAARACSRPSAPRSSRRRRADRPAEGRPP